MAVLTKNSVNIEVIAFAMQRRVAFLGPMLTLLFCLLDCFRPRFVLRAEILALRHQLLVLQRSSRGHKLRLGCTDRVLWVWLSRLWDDWRSALLILTPETVIGWHRKGFRLYLAGRVGITKVAQLYVLKFAISSVR